MPAYEDMMLKEAALIIWTPFLFLKTLFSHHLLTNEVHTPDHGWDEADRPCVLNCMS